MALQRKQVAEARRQRAELRRERQHKWEQGAGERQEILFRLAFFVIVALVFVAGLAGLIFLIKTFWWIF
jgi:hypothetical protein